MAVEPKAPLARQSIARLADNSVAFRVSLSLGCNVGVVRFGDAFGVCLAWGNSNWLPGSDPSVQNLVRPPIFAPLSAEASASVINVAEKSKNCFVECCPALPISNLHCGRRSL